jgi:hypothetical protein
VKVSLSSLAFVDIDSSDSSDFSDSFDICFGAKFLL